MVTQLSFFGEAGFSGPDEPAIDLEFSGARRRSLDEGAWIEHQPEWLSGHATLFEVLTDGMRWRSDHRPMYERVVEVPRLLAHVPDDGPGHPILARMASALSRRYARPLTSISLARYRDGRDSVALHGDRVGRHVDDTVVAIVSLGEPRRFLLKPARGGESLRFDLGLGDLLVMGGTCQRTWRHGVPKVTRAAARISIQFRVGKSASDDAGPLAHPKDLEKAPQNAREKTRVTTKTTNTETPVI